MSSSKADRRSRRSALTCFGLNELPLAARIIALKLRRFSTGRQCARSGRSRAAFSVLAAKTARTRLVRHTDALFSSGRILPNGINFIHVLRNLRRVILGQIRVDRGSELILGCV